MLGELKSYLEDYLLKNIPITAAMGVKVNSASLDKIILQASFSNNINHKKTVFGGSLHAVATLACWSLLHVNTMNLYPGSIQIVIANSEAAFLAPVTSDFKAECCLPDTHTRERFFTTLQKKKKARIKLDAQIWQDGKLCFDYSGVFAAIRTE